MIATCTCIHCIYCQVATYVCAFQLLILYYQDLKPPLTPSSLGSHALQMARSSSHLPYFRHVLELMLHEILEEEAPRSRSMPVPGRCWCVGCVCMCVCVCVCVALFSCMGEWGIKRREWGGLMPLVQCGRSLTDHQCYE